MKFGKKYKLEMEGQDQKKVPGIGYEELKKILKNCRRHLDQSQNDPDHGVPNGISTCPVCDGVFFQTLLKEMSAVIRCFNERVKKLIERHHSSGFHKYFIRLKDKLQGNQIDLIREGKDLITYALINTMAMRKLLKKYDEIHFSKQGQAFKSQAQSRHIEILQSPWLYELMAFHVNLRKAPVLFEGCSVICKPSLSCDLFDSVKLAIDLTCPICLDTVFDAVCLTCGHIFCHMCACKAASVTIVDGMKAADPKEKCPLCREEGVYEGAVHLEELNILLSSSCPEYWDERLQMERVDRVQQAKEHWESQCRAFMGV